MEWNRCYILLVFTIVFSISELTRANVNEPHLVSSDTLILDGEYISIERDTGEYELESGIDTADKTVLASKNESAFSWYGCAALHGWMYSPNDFSGPEGFAYLNSWMGKSRTAQLLKSASAGFAVSIISDFRLLDMRKLFVDARFSAQLGISNCKIPVASSSDANQLRRDSILNFSLDGDDLMLVYFNEFGSGVGEADTVYTKYNLDLLVGRSSRMSLSTGLALQMRNSSWIWGFDVGLGLVKIRPKAKSSRIGWASATEGYFETQWSEYSASSLIEYSLQARLERQLDGIHQGFFEDARVGASLRLCSMSKLSSSESTMDLRPAAANVYVIVKF